MISLSSKNDATKAVAGVAITGVTSGDTITLSQATATAKIAETVNLTSITSGAVTVANAHKAEDTIKFTNATVNTTGLNAETITKVGNAEKMTIIKASETNAGKLTFADSSSSPVVLSITDAVTAINSKVTSGVTAKDVVFYEADDGNTYLINVGDTSATTDDTVVNLGTINVAKITAASSEISFA